MASTLSAVRGGAARWPSSMPPARTNARCSDQCSGATSSTSRANASRRAAIEAFRGSQAERHAVDGDRNLASERPERAASAARLEEAPFRNHLDDVEAVPVREDARGKRGMPGEAEAIARPWSRISAPAASAAAAPAAARTAAGAAAGTPHYRSTSRRVGRSRAGRASSLRGRRAVPRRCRTRPRAARSRCPPVCSDVALRLRPLNSVRMSSRSALPAGV